MIVYIINKLPKKWLRGYGRAYSHNIGTVIRNLKPKMFRGLLSQNSSLGDNMKHVIHRNNKTSWLEIITDSIDIPLYITFGNGIEYSIEDNVITIRNMEQETIKKVNEMNELQAILKRCLRNNTYDHDKMVKQFNRGLFQDIRKSMIEWIKEYDLIGDSECKRIYEDFLIEWFHLISKKDGEYYDRYR